MISFFIGEFDEELLEDFGFIGVSPGAPLDSFKALLLRSSIAFRSSSVRVGLTGVRNSNSHSWRIGHFLWAPGGQIAS
jgi:hypothetical protein